MADREAPGGIGAWSRAHKDKPRRLAARQHSDGEQDGRNDKSEKSGKNPDRKRPGKKPLIILGVVVLVIAIGALIWWFATRNEVSTDDAYTDGNAITIAPKVSGYVTRLNVNDNVFVHKGDLLVEIDKRDYAAQVDQARAQLGLAKAQLLSAQAQLDIARVRIPRSTNRRVRRSKRPTRTSPARRQTTSDSMASIRARPRSKTSIPPTPSSAARTPTS